MQPWDDEVVEISGKTYKEQVYLAGMHLRDATNLFQTLRTIPSNQRRDLLAKTCVLFAIAGLESNLSYLSRCT